MPPDGGGAVATQGRNTDARERVSRNAFWVTMKGGSRSRVTATPRRRYAKPDETGKERGKKRIYRPGKVEKNQ